MKIPRNEKEYREYIDGKLKILYNIMKINSGKIENKKDACKRLKSEKEVLDKAKEYKRFLETNAKEDDLSNIEKYRKWLKLQNLQEEKEEVVGNMSRFHPDNQKYSDNQDDWRAQTDTFKQLSQQRNTLMDEMRKIREELNDFEPDKEEGVRIRQFIKVVDFFAASSIVRLKEEEINSRIESLQKSIGNKEDEISKIAQQNENCKKMCNQLEAMKALLTDGYRIEVDDTTSYKVIIPSMAYIDLDGVKYYMIGYYFPSTELGQQRPHIIRSVICLIEKENILDVIENVLDVIENVLDVIKEDLRKWQKEQIKPSLDNWDTTR